jgi:hypothetical protein
MTLALRTDPAAVLRAIGLLRSYMANDDTHVNAIMEATIEDPDQQSLMRTFSAMFAIAATATASLALANVYGDDEDQILDALQRQLIIGDVTPPEAIS